MSRLTALLDANILYPAPIRDLFLQLAAMDLFHARWTADIHGEWIEALLRRDPLRDRVALERTRSLMDQATRDALITDYESLVPTLSLPDPNDRHVLAAAIVGHCDVIVTQNLTDFPDKVLTSFGIVAQHPDAFLLEMLVWDTRTFCSAVRKIRDRLKSPPYSVNQYLAILEHQGLEATVAELQGCIELL
jgi:hypothetical protein